jgi:histidine ammonia-lyase
MAGHATRLAAVELITAAQAVDLRDRVSELGRGTAWTYSSTREHISFTAAGQAPTHELDPLVRWLESQPN